MYSRHHAAVSAVVAAALVATLPLGDGVVATAWWAALTAAGVLIDLDHFVMARFVRGDWANARRALANPRAAVLDQSALFDPGDLWPLQRLLSHAVIVPVAVLAAWAVGGALGPGVTPWAAGLATAVVLYVHVLTDLIWDVWRQERYHENVRRVAREAGGRERGGHEPAE